MTFCQRQRPWGVHGDGTKAKGTEEEIRLHAMVKTDEPTWKANKGGNLG